MPAAPNELSWNDAMIADFRAHDGRITEGRLAGANLLLMTSIGAKTGQPRTIPLGYSRDGDRYVVVGSNSGFPTQPQWLTNIAADPIVKVEVGTEVFHATATVSHDEERQRLWQIHVAAIPYFATYENMTERQLPVVSLERLPAD